MSRRLSALGVACAAVLAVPAAPRWASAQPAPQPPPASEPPAAAAPATAVPAAPPPQPEDDDEIGDQAISAELGLAAGGRVTPGGLRIVGRYLYRLSERDWFDGAASFTFGSGEGACFRDRQDDVICKHGLADGTGFELSASVRRMFAPQGSFRPFVGLGVGLGVVRFGDDDVTGFTIPLHASAGVRVQVASSVAIIGVADLALGIGGFNRGLGVQPQLGFAVAAGVEFRLR